MRLYLDKVAHWVRYGTISLKVALDLSLPAVGFLSTREGRIPPPFTCCPYGLPNGMGSSLSDLLFAPILIGDLT